MSDHETILKLTEERDSARGEVMNLEAKIEELKQELEHKCDSCNFYYKVIDHNLKLQEEWEKTHPPIKNHDESLKDDKN